MWRQYILIMYTMVKMTSANIPPPKVLIYYLYYYTYFVISIYLSSSFSSFQKASMLLAIAKIHYRKIISLIIPTLKFWSFRLFRGW